MTAHVSAGSSSPKAKTRVSSVPPAVEKLVAEGTFDVDRFVGSFEVLAEAAGGLTRLRQLLLDLAIRGKLRGEIADPTTSTISETDSGADAPFELPLAWRWMPLKDLAVRTDYGTSQKAHVEPHGIPVIRMNNIQDGRLDLSSLKYVPKSTDGLSGLMLAPGDLLFNRTNSLELVGKMAVFRESTKYTFASYLIRVRLNGLAFPQYVNVYFGSWTCRFTQIEPNITSQTNQANFNGTKLKEILVPVPPLAEQKRIVARVDQLMALIDDLEQKQIRKRQLGANFTKASLEALTGAESPEEFDTAWRRVQSELHGIVRFPGDVALLRNAILGLACGGQLSIGARKVDWGTGNEIVESILQARRIERPRLIKKGARPGSLPPEGRTQFDEDVALPSLPASWALCGIDDLLACVPNAMKAGPFGSALTKIMYVPQGYKVYGQEQVISGDHSIGNYYVDKAKFESLKSCAIAPGDMLVSLMGTVGKVLILPPDCEPGIINPRLVKLSLHSSVSREYIRLYLQSPQAQRFLMGAARGVAMDGLNLGILRTLPIALPPQREQAWLLERVDHLMKLCDELEAKLRRAEDRASKLVAAVVGEMVG